MNVPLRPRPFLFVALVIAVLGVFVGAHFGLAQRLETCRQEQKEEAEKSLANEVQSQALEFNRQQWVKEQVQQVIAEVRSRYPLPQGVSRSEAIGKKLSKRYPGAAIFSFDRQGKLIFQTRNEPRRSRETLWTGVLTYQQEGGGNFQESRYQSPQKFCLSLYGGMTNIPELVSFNGQPQYFLDKGRPRLSLVIPEAMFEDSSASSTGSMGGIWLILDPKRLSGKTIAKAVLRRLPGRADVAFIVRRMPDRPFIEAQIGNGTIANSTAAQFFRGRTEFEDSWGLWFGRYIPGEGGRYMIAGVRARNLEGFWGKYQEAFQTLFLALALIFLAFGYRRLWRGVPSRFHLSQQVFLLFALTAVFPLVATCIQGFNLANDQFRGSLHNAEQKLVSTLSAIDLQYREFQKHQGENLRELEKQISRRIPLASDSQDFLMNLCASFTKFEIMVIDDRGSKAWGLKQIESVHRSGDYAILLMKNLARLMDVEGRIPPSIFREAPTILSGNALEGLLNKLFRSPHQFNRLRVRDRNFLQQHSALILPGSTPVRTIGLVSWIFDETEFSTPFVQNLLTESRTRPEKFEAVRLGFASPDGRIFPAELQESSALKGMVERVSKFHMSEIGMVKLGNNRSFLTRVFYPVHLGGYFLIGMIEAPSSETPFQPLEDAKKIAGLQPVLPVEQNRILSLRILLLSIFLSFTLMIPMAILLSKWLVDRVANLREVVKKIGDNHLEARAPIPADDELGQLAQGFNEMAAGLQERERISRFVSDQVREEVKKEDGESLALGGQRREVAVLFSHIHEFQETLASQPPEQVITMLNTYFSLANHAIRDHQGSIDKLIGDAVMAVFFLEPGCDHPAQRAMRAARRMMSAEEEFNRNRLGAGLFTVRTDIGIHFGWAISGKVGSREGMIDFTVIGDTVNTAARIQSAAAQQPQPSILISQEVRQHLPVEEKVTRLEGVTLKGKSQVLDLFLCQP